MDIKDIKVGETYNVRVTVALIGDSIIHCSIGSDTVNFWKSAVSKFSPISPANITKNTEPAPKYDPCRKFKEGDMVSPCFWYDRPPVASAYCGDSNFMPKDGVYKVKEDERNSFVVISYNGRPVFVQACHLKLVTPVKEIEPYSVHESEVVNGFDIVRERMCVMTFPFGSKEAGYYRNKLAAKEAAESECARLNDEYRKEQK